MVSVDGIAAVFIAVLCDMVSENGVILPGSVRQNLALHDLHEPTLFVLELLAENDQRVCLCDVVHEGSVGHIHGTLTQRDHAAIGRLAGIGMDGGQNCDTGSGRLLRRVCLGSAHFANHQNVRVKAQRDVQQGDLCDTLAFVLAVAGQGMDDGVRDRTVFLTHQRQFSGAVFDGEDSLIVGNGGQEPACHGGFAGAGRACHADGYTIAQAGGKEVQHLVRRAAAVHEVRLGHALGIDDTDGGGSTDIGIHNGAFHDGNADIFRKGTHHQRGLVIQNCARHMKHPAQHIDAMFRAVKVFRELLAAPTGILDFNIPPAVDVDFFDSVRKDVLGEKGILGHFRIQGIHQLLLCHALDRYTAVLHKLGDVPLDVGLGLVGVSVRKQLAVLTGDIFLHLLQHTVEIPGFLLRSKK